VPQGGNTSLAGGSVPVYDELILSTRKLNKIEKWDANTNVLTTQSGVVLDNLNAHLKPFECEVPLDLGARGSCLIGGNIAT
jgi:FAD/FMN-containing dehydrogenase